MNKNWRDWKWTITYKENQASWRATANTHTNCCLAERNRVDPVQVSKASETKWVTGCWWVRNCNITNEREKIWRVVDNDWCCIEIFEFTVGWNEWSRKGFPKTWITRKENISMQFTVTSSQLICKLVRLPWLFTTVLKYKELGQNSEMLKRTIPTKGFTEKAVGKWENTRRYIRTNNNADSALDFITEI